MSLITIIIPVRNCEKFISETLDILNTLPGLKILLADGNSSDSTINIVNKYIDNFIELPADWFLDRDYKRKKFDKFNLNEINNFINRFLNKKTLNKLKINKISDEIIEFKKN